MPAGYPHIIKHKRFNPTSKLALASPLQSVHQPTSGVIGCPNKREKQAPKQVQPKRCAAARIWLQVPGGAASGTSYKATDPAHQDLDDSSPTRFCFAPQLEDVEIHWEHEHPEHVAQSILEIYYLKPDGSRRRLWRKRFFWDNCPAQAKTRFNGDLVLDDQNFDDHNNAGLNAVVLDALGRTGERRFPGEFVTAEYSPYQLKLTVVPKSGATVDNPSVWMYFDVQIGKIVLRWCDPAHIDAILPNTRLAQNRALYDALTNDPDNLNGALPAPGEVKKVYLPSNTFYKNTTELTDHTSYERYRALWGDGPIIPIFAEVQVLDSTGNPVSAPLAVGRHKFMWEWVDAAEAHWPGGDVNIRTFMDTTRAYKTAATADSPVGMNCHVDRGGKRGIGARTCFPPQPGFRESANLAAHDGSDQMLPFTVQPMNRNGSPFTTTRRWCAYSEAWGKGLLAGQTGVLFQPSRMAGDGYALHVYALYTSDAEMENQITPANIPARLHAQTGTFQVWRQLDVLKRWLLRTTSLPATPIDLAQIQAKFEHYHIKLTAPANPVNTLGAWFATLTNVCNGVGVAPLPEHIREAVDPTQHTHLITTRTYAQWRTRMEALHGTGNALYTWAENVPNYTDPSGNMVWSSWEMMDGNNGMTMLMRPFPLNEDPEDHTDQGDGTVVVEFLDVNQSVTLVFDAPRVGHRPTAVTAAHRNQLKSAVAQALSEDLGGILGATRNRVSYQHPRCPSRLLHRPLRFRLSGRATVGRHHTRFANVRAALADAVEAEFYERSESLYKDNLKYGLVFIMFNAVMEAMLSAEFPAAGGLVAIQVQDLTNAQTTAGKAFYANATGERALAACLATPAHQRTMEHEIGHALFLNHTYHSQESSDPNFFHQKAHPSTGNCLLHYSPTGSCFDTSMFCGFCQARLSGWSVLTVDPATDTTAAPRTIYYDPDYNQDPGAPPGAVPHPVTPATDHDTDLV